MLAQTALCSAQQGSRSRCLATADWNALGHQQPLSCIFPADVWMFAGRLRTLCLSWPLQLQLTWGGCCCAGGRDSVCRVWDMRTKVQVHCLAGHDDTVASILANPTSPEVCCLLPQALSCQP